VALAIAATALLVLMGRVGASADTQRTLVTHELALDAATNELAKESLQASVSGAEQSGVVKEEGMELRWRSWTEKTLLPGFVRRNIAVSAPGEPDVTLFLYKEVR